MPATRAKQVVGLLDTTRKRRQEDEQRRHEAWRQALQRSGVDVDWLEKQPPIIQDIVQGIGLPMRSLMQTPPGRFVERASQTAGEQVLFAPGELAKMQGGYVPVGHPTADMAAHYAGLIVGNIAQYGMGGQLGASAAAQLGRLPQLARLGQIAHPALRTAGRGVATGLGVSALQSALYPEHLKPSVKDVAQTAAFHAGAGIGGDVALMTTRHMLPGLHPLAESAVAGAMSGLGGGVATLPFKEDRPAMQHLKDMGVQMASMAVMRTFLTAIRPETWEPSKQFAHAMNKGVDAINKASKGLETDDARMTNAGVKDFQVAMDEAYHYLKQGLDDLGISPEEFRSLSMEGFIRAMGRMGYQTIMPESGLPAFDPRMQDPSSAAGAPLAPTGMLEAPTGPTGMPGAPMGPAGLPPEELRSPSLAGFLQAIRKMGHIPRPEAGLPVYDPRMQDPPSPTGEPWGPTGTPEAPIGPAGPPPVVPPMPQAPIVVPPSATGTTPPTIAPTSPPEQTLHGELAVELLNNYGYQRGLSLHLGGLKAVKGYLSQEQMDNLKFAADKAGLPVTDTRALIAIPSTNEADIADKWNVFMQTIQDLEEGRVAISTAPSPVVPEGQPAALPEAPPAHRPLTVAAHLPTRLAQMGFPEPMVGAGALQWNASHMTSEEMDFMQQVAESVGLETKRWEMPGKDVRQLVLRNLRNDLRIWNQFLVALSGAVSETPAPPSPAPPLEGTVPAGELPTTALEVPPVAPEAPPMPATPSSTPEVPPISPTEPMPTTGAEALPEAPPAGRSSPEDELRHYDAQIRSHGLQSLVAPGHIEFSDLSPEQMKAVKSAAQKAVMTFVPTGKDSGFVTVGITMSGTMVMDFIEDMEQLIEAGRSDAAVVLMDLIEEHGGLDFTHEEYITRLKRFTDAYTRQMGLAGKGAPTVVSPEVPGIIKTETPPAAPGRPTPPTGTQPIPPATPPSTVPEPEKPTPLSPEVPLPGEVKPSAGIPTDEIWSYGEETLEDIPADIVPGAGERGDVGGSTVRGPGEHEGAPGRPPPGGDDVRGGVGGGEGGVPAAPSGAGLPEAPEPGRVGRGRNYLITDADEIGAGGTATKLENNINAIKILKRIEAEGRPATPEEQAVLIKYVGWGGLSQAFHWKKPHPVLQVLLTPEEWDSARRSTLNAHYTNPPVIRAMYDALARLGYRGGGRILEPALGIGHFFGLLPPELAQGTRLTGVELDSLSGRIARRLYPDADIRIEGFEEAQLLNDFFDVAISNVPFGDYGVTDPVYEKKRVTSPIHNYFFAKALDKVRPGGLVVFITTRYTMDAKDPYFRHYIGQQADLVGAIRLPNTTFKASAGTEVTTDILFLRKRLPGEKPSGEKWLGLAGVPVEEGKTTQVNEYFAKHPEMVLGTHSLTGSMYQADEYTLKADDRPLETALAEAIANLPENVMKDIGQPVPEPPPEIFQAMDDAKALLPGSYIVINGGIYQKGVDTDALVPVRSRGKQLSLQNKVGQRIDGMIKLHAVLMDYNRLQYTDAPEKELQAGRKKLNAAYDAFVQKHGPVHSRGNSNAFSEDPRYGALAALEVNYRPPDKDAGITESVEKADIFTVRTVMPHRPVEKADTPKEALLVSLAERGFVDLKRMEDLTGISQDDLLAALEGEIYLDPETGRHEIAEGYLSGNVRRKLQAAELAAKTDPAFKANVAALKAVQPKDIPIEQIHIKFGAGWVPGEIVTEFVEHLFEANHVGGSIHYEPITGNWIVDISRRNLWAGRSQTLNNEVWGVEGKDGISIIRDLLAYRQPAVYMTDADGVRRLDRDATLVAREKAQKIQEEFTRWARHVWGDRLAAIYNEKFNSTRLRQYDGSHLILPGTSPDIKLREHQKNAIWRILQSPNTLIAHEVGGGKTFTLVAAAMEMRRLGLARKPMVVVPNHLVGQWADEVRKLYPAAKILMATEKNFATTKRRQFLNQIMTGDWDLVIVRESHYKMISPSKEYVGSFFKRQLKELEEAIKANKGNEKTVKELEKALARLEKLMKDKLESLERDPGVIPFEQLGVDALMVDESHRFKNLLYATAMGRVAGLGDKDGSAKAFDMWMKTSYITELNNGRGVVFATGTPIANSMAEMFTLTRYLRPDILKELGIHMFDAWASTFGEVVTALEVAPEGGTYRPKERFSRFKNVAELLKIFYSFADVQTAETMKLPRPTLNGGKRTVVVREASEALKSYIVDLAHRAEAVRMGRVHKSEDNMLKITSDGRKAALDIRLVDPSAPDLPDSKVNVATDNIYSIWERTNKDRLTQLVFLDLGVPKEKSDDEVESEVYGDEEDESVRLVVYNDLKRKLIAKGVPAEEIAFIHDAKTVKAKDRLFRRVREGKVRILVGSTERMGVGTNVQKLAIALHHLDVPWRPADIGQREGRILRQGNKNPEVAIYVYATQGSFDEFMWDTIERKATFINQVLSGDLEVRELEDVGEMVLSAAEVKALASSNPALREHVTVMAEIRRLQVLEAQHRHEQYKYLEDTRILPDVIEVWAEIVANIDKDIKAGIPDTKGDKFAITIGKKTYTERKDAEEALRNEASRAAKKPAKERIEIGKIAGFTIYATEKGQGLILKRNAEYTAGPSIRSIEHHLANLEKAREAAQQSVERLRSKLAAAKEQLDKPFPYADKMQELDLRRLELEAELQIGEHDKPSVEERLSYEASEGRQEQPRLPEEYPAEAVAKPPVNYVMDLFNFAKELGTPARSKSLKPGTLGTSVIDRLGAESQIEVLSVEYIHTLAHEIGHQLDFILSGRHFPESIKRRFPASRFDEVQLRAEAIEVSLLMRPVEGGKRAMSEYRRKLTELMADVYQLYLTDPELLAEVAPGLYEAINDRLEKHPKLHKQLQDLHQRRLERWGEEHPDIASLQPGDVDLASLIPEDIRESQDPDKMLKALITYADRLLRFRRQAAITRANEFKEQFTDEQLEDMGAYVEKIGNIRTGKSYAAIRRGMTPEMHKAVAEYRYTQEKLREQLNFFVEDAVGKDYIQYLDDYLAHFYISTPKQRKDFTAKWSKKIRAAQKRKFPTLQEAVDEGFIPVTQNMADLQRMWVEVNWRAAINMVLVKELMKVQNDEGLPVVMKPQDAPAHWPIVHHPAVRRVYAHRTKDGALHLWEGGAAIDPDAYKILRQLFEHPFRGWGVPQLEGIKAWMKKCQLSFSMFFHMSIVESMHATLPARLGPQRSLLLLGKGFKTGIAFLGMKITRPHIEGLELLKSEEFLKDAIMHGVTLGGEFTGTDRIRKGMLLAEHKASIIPGADYLARKFRQFNEWWDEALWDRLHLGSKAYAYYYLVGELMKDMPPDADPAEVRHIKHMIAEYVNDNFGGQEWSSKFWISPQGRQLLNMLLLAPDWTISQLNMGTKTFSQIKDPTSRRLHLRHWRQMIMGLATFIAMANYALVRKWPWQNEPGHKMDIDVTPIMQSFSWNKDVQRRWYIGPGKQGRELLRWVTSPLVQLGNKFSPLIRIAVEQVSGHQAGSGFPMDWMRGDEELSFYESIPARIRAVMSEFVPFAWSGANFMFTWPMSRGMGVWRALRSYEDLIAAQVDPKLYQRLMPRADYDRLKAELDAAAKANGLDAKKMYTQANTAVRTRYYSRFWAAVERQDEKEARRIADILRKLGATRETLTQSGERREIDKQTVKKVGGLLPGKPKKSTGSTMRFRY